MKFEIMAIEQGISKPLCAGNDAPKAIAQMAMHAAYLAKRSMAFSKARIDLYVDGDTFCRLSETSCNLPQPFGVQSPDKGYLCDGMGWYDVAVRDHGAIKLHIGAQMEEANQRAQQHAIEIERDRVTALVAQLGLTGYALRIARAESAGELTIIADAAKLQAKPVKPAKPAKASA